MQDQGGHERMESGDMITGRPKWEDISFTRRLKSSQSHNLLRVVVDEDQLVPVRGKSKPRRHSDPILLEWDFKLYNQFPRKTKDDDEEIEEENHEKSQQLISDVLLGPQTQPNPNKQAPPTTLKPIIQEGGLSFYDIPSPGRTRPLAGGTLESLTKYCINSGDIQFTKIFIYTMHFWASKPKLLEFLIETYKNKSTEPTPREEKLLEESTDRPLDSAHTSDDSSLVSTPKDNPPDPSSNPKPPLRSSTGSKENLKPPNPSDMFSITITEEEDHKSEPHPAPEGPKETPKETPTKDTPKDDPKTPQPDSHERQKLVHTHPVFFNAVPRHPETHQRTPLPLSSRVFTSTDSLVPKSPPPDDAPTGSPHSIDSGTSTPTQAPDQRSEKKSAFDRLQHASKAFRSTPPNDKEKKSERRKITRTRTVDIRATPPPDVSSLTQKKPLAPGPLGAVVATTLVSHASETEIGDEVQTRRGERGSEFPPVTKSRTSENRKPKLLGLVNNVPVKKKKKRESRKSSERMVNRVEGEGEESSVVWEEDDTEVSGPSSPAIHGVHPEKHSPVSSSPVKHIEVPPAVDTPVGVTSPVGFDSEGVESESDPIVSRGRKNEHKSRRVSERTTEKSEKISRESNKSGSAKKVISKPKNNFQERLKELETKERTASPEGKEKAKESSLEDDKTGDKKNKIWKKKPTRLGTDSRSKSGRIMTSEERRLMEQTANTRAIVATNANNKIFTVYLGIDTKKSLIFMPNKKVHEVLSGICLSRGLNITECEIRNMAGEVIDVNANTTLNDLHTAEILFNKKGEDPFLKPEEELEDTTPVPPEMTEDQRNAMKVLHAWLEFNIKDFEQDAVKKITEQFFRILDPYNLHDTSQRMRLCRSGLRNSADYLNLMAEIIVSDPNKFQKKAFEGEVILDWLINNKKLLVRVDCIEVCKKLVEWDLLKRCDEKAPKKFALKDKFRLICPRLQVEFTRTKLLTLSSPAEKQSKSILDFPHTTFAKQLTYYEFNLFKAVDLKEVNYWLKGEKEERHIHAPNLLALTNFVNKVTLWVASEILISSNVKNRQSVIKHFINIAKCCHELNNFDGVLEIIMGLNHAAVERMKLSWNIPEKYTSTFKSLLDFTSPNVNWQNLRKAILDTNPEKQGFVPYIGLYLSDLTFIKDGGGGTLPNGHIGWEKNQKMFEILEAIEVAKTRNLIEDIHPDMVYQQYLSNELVTFEENELFKRSKTYEPPARRAATQPVK